MIREQHRPIVDRLVRGRVTPTVRARSAEQADAWASAIVSGGIDAFEFTATTPQWQDVLREWSQRGPGVGLGTVTSAEVAEQAIEAGAHFLVSPFAVPDARAVADRAGILFIEGGLTPNEIRTAAIHGVAKLFPAHVGGLQYLASLRAVLPGALITATGGIGVADARSWLEAGAAAVSIGSDLFAAPDIEQATHSLLATVADVPLTSIPTSEGGKA